MSKKPDKQNTAEKKKTVPELTDYFKSDWINLAILFFFWLILFRELISGSAWLHDDFPYVYYPGKFLTAVSLSEGVFPFWNPYSFGGMPFFSDPQVAILYPFNYILKFFVSNSYLSPLVVQNILVLHYLLLSVLCYYLAREFKLGNFVCLLFSIMFTYSSYMIIHMIHMNLIETVIWLPLLFLLVLKFINEKKYIFIIVAGIVMAVSVLAGYPQCFFYNYLFILTFFLYKIVVSIRSKDYHSIKVFSTGLALFFAISVCISSVQLLPTYVLSENSSRAETGYEFAKQGSVHPIDLVTLFVPKVFGTFNWNKSAEEVSYWSVKSNGGHQEGSYMYTVSTLYLTLLPMMILFPVLSFLNKTKKKSFPFWFFAIVSVIVLMFSFGGNFFVHQIFYSFIPFFNRFRNPGHITYIFSFCILLITAYGLNIILSNKDEIKKYFSAKYFLIMALTILLVFFMSVSGFFKSASGPSANPQIYSWITKQINIFVILALTYLACFYLYFNGKINPGIFRILLLAVLLIDIYLFAFNQNNGDTNPATLYSQNSNLINQIKQNQKDELFRVNMREGRNILFQRYQGAIDRIQFLEGINVLNLSRMFPVNNDVNTNQLYDLMNVKYKIKVDEKSKSMSLTENEGYLPRARMYYDVKVIPEENKIKEYMKSSEFDFRKTLVLEKAPPEITLSSSDTNSIPESKIEFNEYGLNKIKITAETVENGFLLLSEIFYPDWKAYIDGKESEIYRADYSLRALYLEKGKHTVEFVYDSNEFNIGSKLSLAMLALSFLLIGFIYFKQKKSGVKN